MSVLRARTLVWAPRCSFLVVSSPNHRSTRLSHELEVGVKWTTNRGWASSHLRMAGVLWVEALSRTRWTARWSGTSLSIVARNFLNSIARCRGCREPVTLTGGDLQRREQRRGAMPVVVVGATLD